MLNILLRRLLIGVPTLFILITVTFFLLRQAPGGPFDTERVMSPQLQQAVAEKYHLNDPFYKQYYDYVTSILSGDFGPSFQYHDLTVNHLIGKALPVSLTLGFYALLLALLMGLLMGIFSAIGFQRWPDKLLMTLAIVGISVPNFVFASLFILIFSVYWGRLPAGGWGDGTWQHLILPVVALSLPFMAYIARLVRVSLLEALNTDAIRTAYAKGLSHTHVVLYHALPMALLPVISWLGPAAASIMTGSVVIEKIFGLPGLGRYFVQGAQNRDYPLIMGVVIVIGVFIVVFNIITDILASLVDPAAGKHHLSS